jgi:hypothetical protein
LYQSVIIGILFRPTLISYLENNDDCITDT